MFFKMYVALGVISMVIVISLATAAYLRRSAFDDRCEAMGGVPHYQETFMDGHRIQIELQCFDPHEGRFIMREGKLFVQ